MNKFIFSTLLCLASLISYGVKASTYVPQQQLVYINTNHGQVVLQILPQIAPNHAQRFSQLVQQGAYDGLSFYRVIDGFVAQGGAGDNKNKLTKFGSLTSPLKGEFTAPISQQFQLIQSPALLAPETGFINSVPAGRDKTTNEQWFLHCPAIVAMARSTDAHSATTEFYINIGQAPRHLDRNMSVFARVVSGMNVVQKFTRGDVNAGGVIKDESQQAKIVSARLGSQLPKQQQLLVSVESVDSERFQQRLASAKNKTNAFYVYPGNGNVDVCYYQPKVTVKSMN